MKRLNDSYFTPGAFQVARGASDSGNVGWPEPNGGMLNPRRVHLTVGSRYYRFASSGKPHAAQLHGGWWIEFETIRKIARFASEHSDARHAVRYFLAVPWSWNSVDKVVSGFLREPLDAYRGEGRAVSTVPGAHSRDGGTRYIPPQHLKDLYQLYIPGMHEIGPQAFPAPKIENIWDNEHFAR